MLGLKTVRGCFGSIVMIGLLIVAAYGGWRWGAPVFERFERWTGRAPDESAPAVSQELADVTLRRFESFRRGDGGDRLSLGSAEVESVLRFGVPGLVPASIAEPRVQFSDGSVQVTGNLAVEAVSDLPDLGGVLGFLPDTLEVAIEGTLVPFDNTHAALVVHRIQAMRIPLPDRMIPEFLWAFGRDRDSEMSQDAMPVPLPEGIESAYILRDSLVLVHRR
jgi:hypothetical protein